MSLSSKNAKSYGERRAAIWYAAAFLCTLFWPVGLVLLIINANSEE